VTSLDTGVTKASLQKAHNAAKAGQRLTLRGTCTGVTTLRKSLTISGIRTKPSGKPILDAKLNGTVVTVQPGVKVTMRGLTIRGGAMPGLGGGINNAGTLVLRDVIVRSNTAMAGAGW
jgi:nitrous oxidase accessory protein NosD